MRFEEKDKMLYCKDNSYNKNCDYGGYTNGYYYYYYNGLFYKGYLIHRDDGPAIEYSNGDKCWYLNGKKYTKNEYWEIINAMNKIDNKQRVLDDI